MTSMATVTILVSNAPDSRKGFSTAMERTLTGNWTGLWIPLFSTAQKAWYNSKSIKLYCNWNCSTCMPGARNHPKQNETPLFEAQSHVRKLSWWARSSIRSITIGQIMNQVPMCSDSCVTQVRYLIIERCVYSVCWCYSILLRRDWSLSLVHSVLW